MKKIIILVVLLAVILSISGCEKKENNDEALNALIGDMTVVVSFSNSKVSGMFHEDIYFDCTANTHILSVLSTKIIYAWDSDTYEPNDVSAHSDIYYEFSPPDGENFFGNPVCKGDTFRVLCSTSVSAKDFEHYKSSKLVITYYKDNYIDKLTYEYKFDI